MTKTEKELLVQGNYLVEHRSMMTRDENRLFMSLVATVQKDDDTLEYEISVKDFVRTWETANDKYGYEAVKRAAEGLRSKGLTLEEKLPDGKRRFQTMGFLSYAEYVEGSGKLKVGIDAHFKPHLINIKNRFTKYRLRDVVDLDASGASVTTMRIYELCCEWIFTGGHSFGIDELKDKLELYTKKGREKVYKYPRNVDFRKYIIDPAMDAINHFTDLSVGYVLEGRGEKMRVAFSIEKKPLVEEVPQPDQGDGSDSVPQLPAAPDAAPAPAQDETPLDDQRIAGSRCNPDPDSDMVDWCADSFKAFRPHGVEFTRAEMKLMMKAAGKWLPAGDDLAMMDYFDAQADYITDNWQRIRSKKAYIKRAVKENYAEFEP